MREERIGDCRLILGDALSVLRDIPSGSVGAVLCDPPYSSGGTMRGDRMGKTSVKYQSTEHRGIYEEFLGDTRDQRSFTFWSTVWLSECWRATQDGGIAAVFIDWRQLPAMTDALQAAGWVWRGIAVWNKTEAARPQKGRYRAQAEYIVWASKGQLLDEGPCAPGVFTLAANAEEKEHIAAKPVQLMADLLSIMRGPVLDPFMGSCPVGVACARLGLPYVGIELSSYWHAAACRRVEAAYRQADLFREPAAPKPEQVELLA